MADTKELVERDFEVLATWAPSDEAQAALNRIHAALSELEARLEAAEARMDRAERGRVKAWNRAEAAERERDSWAASHAERDKLLWAAEARVAELEEALLKIAGLVMIDPSPTRIEKVREIARAALDRAKEGE